MTGSGCLIDSVYSYITRYYSSPIPLGCCIAEVHVPAAQQILQLLQNADINGSSSVDTTSPFLVSMYLNAQLEIVPAKSLAHAWADLSGMLENCSGARRPALAPGKKCWIGLSNLLSVNA